MAKSSGEASKYEIEKSDKKKEKYQKSKVVEAAPLSKEIASGYSTDFIL